MSRSFQVPQPAIQWKNEQCLPMPNWRLKTLQLIVSFWGEHRVLRSPHPWWGLFRCARAQTPALEHAPPLERSRAGTLLPPRWNEKIPTDTTLNIRPRIKTVKCKSMQYARLECSQRPAQFHQMQYDSNYHTQVLYRVAMLKIMHDLYFSQSMSYSVVQWFFETTACSVFDEK